LQCLALNGGLDGIMIGGYLTTGGRSPAEDKQMLQDLGRTRTQPVLN
jgi:biotin synthase